jgi:hypothetical protein
LETLGFTPSPSDSCLFYKEVNGAPLWVAIFVDDIVISSPDMDAIDAFKHDMSQRFNMKDLLELSTILGIEVIRDRTAGTISLVQNRYISDF